MIHIYIYLGQQGLLIKKSFSSLFLIKRWTCQTTNIHI